MSTFLLRLKSSIILMAVTFLLMYTGGLTLLLGISVISLIGLGELYRAEGFLKTGLAGTGLILGAGLEAMVFFSLPAPWPEFYPAAVLIFLLAVYVFAYPKYDDRQIAITFFGLLYVVGMLSYVYRIRALEGGRVLVWLIFICAWGCDVMAYCTGMLIGKHKMSPLLSPKKTVEGAVGGVAGAALIGLLYALIFREKLVFLPNAEIDVPILCAVGGAISMIGDLAASAIKRNRGIKDYGTLIPGHGGILDRFDSIIVTAPIVYYLIVLLQR